MRRRLVTPAALVFVACAKIAGLEPASSTGPATPTTDAGSLPPSPEGIRVSLQNLEKPVPCGAATEFQYLTLESESAADVAFEVSVPEGSPFTVRAKDGAPGVLAKGTVPGKGLVTLYVSLTSPTPGPVNGDLFVKTGATEQRVATNANVVGSLLTMTPGLVDFGDVRKDTESDPQPVALKNEGTTRVIITGWTPAGNTDFAFTPGTLEIEPGVTQTVSARLTAGGEGLPLSVPFTPVLGSALCAPPPALTVKGARVNQEITVTPGGLSFGNVDCNSNVAPKTVTISNYSNKVETFTVTLQPDSWFTVSALAGTVERARGPTPGITTLMVGLKPTANLDARSETVTIAITGAPSVIKSLTANVQVVGALLEMSPASLAFNAAGQTRSFVVRNLGNRRIKLGHGSTVTAFDPADESVIEAAGAGAPFFQFDRATVSVRVGTTPGTYSGDITTVRLNSTFGSAKLCNDPAPVVKVTAQF